MSDFIPEIEFLGVTQEDDLSDNNLHKDKQIISEAHTVSNNVNTYPHESIQNVLSPIHKSDLLEQSKRINNSEVVVKKKTESLKILMTYDISSDEASSDENLIESEIYRNVKEISSSSDTDTDSSDSESDSADSLSEDSSSRATEDEICNATVSERNKGAVKKSVTKSTAPKTLGEIDLIDLPPLPDLSQLKIDYEKEEFTHIGNVLAMVDTIVTIEALPNTPAYDLDTVLFIEQHTKKKPIGTIYDVIGPVSSPIYCIRFNNTEEIQEKGINFGMPVYSAPKSEFTQYVFLKELMKIKGTDASWLGDNELPSELIETSSDESISEEKSFQHAKRKRCSLERHRKFERNMNRCNSLNTRIHRMVDNQLRGSSLPEPSENIQVPLFNPFIPPPGFVSTARCSTPATTVPSTPPPNFVPAYPGRQYSLPPPFSVPRNFSNFAGSNHSDRPNNRQYYQW